MCRKVYDEEKVRLNQKKLIEYYDDTMPPGFYDEVGDYDYIEDSESEEGDADDEEWLPDHAEYPERIRIGNMRITRAVAVQLRQAGIIEHPFAYYHAPLGSLFPEE